MFGMAIGFVCLFGLTKVLGRNRYGRRWRYHRRARMWGHTHMLHWAYQRLDTTHGQEKIISQEFGILRDAAKTWQSDWHNLRTIAAAQVRGEHIDVSALDDFWRQQDVLIAKMRQSVGDSLSKMHEVLNQEQRELLARRLARG